MSACAREGCGIRFGAESASSPVGQASRWHAVPVVATRSVDMHKKESARVSERVK